MPTDLFNNDDPAAAAAAQNGSGHLVRASGRPITGRSRKWESRLAAIPAAIARRDEFITRVDLAAGDVARLADLMAEAIDLECAARGTEPAGRDGRAVVSMDEICAAHCAIAARDAYRRAKGSNSG